MPVVTAAADLPDLPYGQTATLPDTHRVRRMIAGGLLIAQPSSDNASDDVPDAADDDETDDGWDDIIADLPAADGSTDDDPA